MSVNRLTNLLAPRSPSVQFLSLPSPATSLKPRLQIAWTYLYATMGYASHLISLSPLTSASTALSLYYAQLGLNLVWTPTFFGFRRPDVALIDIVALTGTVFTLTVRRSGFPCVERTSAEARFPAEHHKEHQPDRVLPPGSLRKPLAILFLPQTDLMISPETLTVRLALVRDLPQRRRLLAQRRQEVPRVRQEGQGSCPGVGSGEARPLKEKVRGMRMRLKMAGCVAV